MVFKVTLKQSIKKEIEAPTPEEALKTATDQVTAADTKFQPENYTIKEVAE